jgi:hypothetical protein
VDQAPAQPAFPWVTVLVAGTALGLFSAMGDRLPADTPLHVLVALANAAGPWLAVAFTVGAVARRPWPGALAAAASLAIAILLYYLGIYAAGNSVADLARVAGVWLAAAFMVGPALGACGAVWASHGHWRVAAGAALPGVLLAEACQRLIQVEAWTGLDLSRTDIQVGIVETTAGLLLPALLLGRGERAAGYGTSAAVGIVGFGCIWGATALIRAVVA